MFQLHKSTGAETKSQELQDKTDEKEVGGGGGGCCGLSIAERRAMRCGFNAERITVARFRSSNGVVLASPKILSPYLTIPPGISPTALFDSPVLLPNSLPSHATGMYLFPSSANHADECHGSDIDSSLNRFNSELHSLPSFSSWHNQVSSSLEFSQRNTADCQAFEALDSVEPPLNFEFPNDLSNVVTSMDYAADSITHTKVSVNMNSDEKDSCLMKVSCSDLARDQSSRQKEPLNSEDTTTNDLVKDDKRGTCPLERSVATSEDGYNWRKYGQKQVKGSDYPRSYYKCVHLQCQVKKKVERSHDGQITEIIYNGAHNHPRPQPNHRTQFGSTFSFGEPEAGDESGTNVKTESSYIQREIQGIGEGSVSEQTDLSDPFSTTTAIGDSDDDERFTHGRISFDNCLENEESESKRRKAENCLNETYIASSRAVRESRVVLQIESDRDVLDDGYRWRKYGQKVVKGNPNPRSYYKCTSAGCSVRKHVERASHNLNCVITTYEGKHNHEVPSARNSCRVNLGVGNNLLNLADGSKCPPTLGSLPRNPQGMKPETRIEETAQWFGQESNFNWEYWMRPSFLGGSFIDDMEFPGSPLYEMNFSPFQNALLYGSFVLNSNCGAVHQVDPIPSIMPDFPISLPSGLSTSGNLPTIDGFDFSPNGKHVGPFQSFTLNDIDLKFLRPKQELRDDNDGLRNFPS